MDHKSWEGYRNEPSLARTQALANRNFYVGITVDQTSTEIVSPLTGDTIIANEMFETGSKEWCEDLAQQIVDTGPNGFAISFVEDVAVDNDTDPTDLELIEKPGFVTFFIKAGVY